MKTVRPAGAFAAALAILALAGHTPALGANLVSTQGLVQRHQPAVAVDPAALLYCQKTGGQVQVRTAVYGSKPLVLSGQATFCKYTASDKSSISLFLDTLYTTKPTLAVLAYAAKPKIPTTCFKSSNYATPAACYCITQLGGSDLDNIQAGGAWLFGSDYLEVCVFPDLSAIDSYGLFYHAGGVIRGINLTKVLRYKPPATL
jgi:putative hemolysin